MKSKTIPPKANYTEKINDIKFNMIFVEGGDVYIGEEQDKQKVKVPDFHIAETPCTQELWRAVMGKDPERLAFKGDKRPVERVSWLDIVEGTPETNNKAFLDEFNKKSEYGGYKLPSEAMWQFAAQGGKLSEDYAYAGSNVLKEVGWYYTNSHSETKPVGLKLSNALGLYDMSGNVWEWCADIGNEKGDKGIRVLRGGSWSDYDGYCRVAGRDRVNSDFRFIVIGFRLARY